MIFDSKLSLGQGDTGADGSGGGDGDWLSSLPETIRGNEAFKGLTGPDVLAQKYLDTLGRVPVVPEGPDKYQIPDFEGADPSVSAGLKGALAKLAHENGMTQAQAAAVYQGYMGHIKGVLDAGQQEAAKEVEALKTEWGKDYDINAMQARRAAVLLGLDGVFEKAGILNHAGTLKAMKAAFAMLSEDSFKDKNKETPPAGPPNKTEDGRIMLSYPNSPNMGK